MDQGSYSPRRAIEVAIEITEFFIVLYLAGSACLLPHLWSSSLVLACPDGWRSSTAASAPEGARDLACFPVVQHLYQRRDTGRPNAESGGDQGLAEPVVREEAR